MKNFIINYSLKLLKKISLSITILSFAIQTFFPTIGFAQHNTKTSLSLSSVGITPSIKFAPSIIQGLQIDMENPFEFGFIIDTGDSNLSGKAFINESKKLINYFLASLTIPEEDMWVNLSPYEKNRIIPEALSKTELVSRPTNFFIRKGRNLLWFPLNILEKINLSDH